MPTIAGRPSSRLTMAAWQVRPPRLVTMAAAFFMIGSQSGSVLSVTSTSPSWNWSRMCTLLITRTGPAAIFSPTLRPRNQHRPLAFEAVDLDRRPAILARLDRLRPGLDDEQLAGTAVLGPFDVHRRRLAALLAVVVLDDAGPARQRQDLVVADGEADCGRRAGTGTFFTIFPPPTS